MEVRTFRGILIYYKKEVKNNLTFLEKSSENIYGLKSQKVIYIQTRRST